MNNFGKIVSINGQVVEVEFLEDAPDLFDVLVLEGEDDVFLEVYVSASESSFYCLALSSTDKLSRGKKLINTHAPLRIPVGKGILGRSMNLFGIAQDGKGEVLYDKKLPIIKNSDGIIDDVQVSEAVVETGIKAIDFFAPLFKGGKVGLFGGAGVGKTVLLTELINNIVIHGSDSEGSLNNKDAVSIFCAIGERIREAQELYENLEEAKVLGKTCLIMAQMDENPAVRFRTALAGVTLAEYFRDEQQNNVLFFADNVFRFAQAGYELSTLIKSIPSEDGYQPTLTSEMGGFHERLVSTSDGSVTSIEAVYVQSDDITDYAVRSIFPYLDTIIILSRSFYQQGILPAIDVLASISSAIDIDVIGKDHYDAYVRAKKLLEEAIILEKIVSLVGLGELSEENRNIYMRAAILKNYMTQNFFVTEKQSGKPGTRVPLKQTIEDVKGIIEGSYDHISADKFLFIGSAKDERFGSASTSSVPSSAPVSALKPEVVGQPSAQKPH